MKTVLAKLSQEVQLSCGSLSPWFFCVWEGPKGDRVCALREDAEEHREQTGMCGGAGRLHIRGKTSGVMIFGKSPD